MTRILQIVHDHPALTSGGTEWIAADLTRALVARGHDAVLLAASTALGRPDAAPGALERLDGDYLLRTGRYDRFSMLREDGEAWTRGLASVLDAHRPEVVHLHGLDRIGAQAVPFLRSRCPDARILLTLHDFQLVCANDGLMVDAEGALCHGAAPDACRRCLPQVPLARHALRKAHLLAVLSQVDLLIAPSRFLRQRFIDWGIAPDRIALVPNGVPPAPPAPPPHRGDRFAFFGNIADHKGVPLLLEAAARLAARQAALRITLHGGFTWADPEGRARLAAGLDRAAPVAQHLGPYRRADLPALMAGADWVVMPSTWWENAPLVLLEAQRAGRPVICTGIGGMAEMVRDGIDGLHVPRGDVATLVETLLGAADPDLCRRMAANTRPPPGVDDMASACLDLYARQPTELPA